MDKTWKAYYITILELIKRRRQNMVKGNIVRKALEEYEKIKKKDPDRAKRLAGRGAADVYGLQPMGRLNYGTTRIIKGYFRNGRLDYIEK